MLAVTFFCNHWVSLSTLRVFLVSALYYAYNTLKVMRFLNSANTFHPPSPSTTTLIHHRCGWCWLVVESIAKNLLLRP